MRIRFSARGDLVAVHRVGQLLELAGQVHGLGRAGSAGRLRARRAARSAASRSHRPGPARPSSAAQRPLGAGDHRARRPRPAARPALAPLCARVRGPRARGGALRSRASARPASARGALLAGAHREPGLHLGGTRGGGSRGQPSRAGACRSSSPAASRGRDGLFVELAVREGLLGLLLRGFGGRDGLGAARPRAAAARAWPPEPTELLRDARPSARRLGGAGPAVRRPRCARRRAVFGGFFQLDRRRRAGASAAAELSPASSTRCLDLEQGRRAGRAAVRDGRPSTSPSRGDRGTPGWRRQASAAARSSTTRPRRSSAAQRGPQCPGHGDQLAALGAGGSVGQAAAAPSGRAARRRSPARPASSVMRSVDARRRRRRRTTTATASAAKPSAAATAASAPGATVSSAATEPSRPESRSAAASSAPAPSLRAQAELEGVMRAASAERSRSAARVGGAQRCRAASSAVGCGVGAVSSSASRPSLAVVRRPRASSGVALPLGLRRPRRAARLFVACVQAVDLGLARRRHVTATALDLAAQLGESLAAVGGGPRGAARRSPRRRARSRPRRGGVPRRPARAAPRRSPRRCVVLLLADARGLALHVLGVAAAASSPRRARRGEVTRALGGELRGAAQPLGAARRGDTRSPARWRAAAPVPGVVPPARPRGPALSASSASTCARRSRIRGLVGYAPARARYAARPGRRRAGAGGRRAGRPGSRRRGGRPRPGGPAA